MYGTRRAEKEGIIAVHHPVPVFMRLLSNCCFFVVVLSKGDVSTNACTARLEFGRQCAFAVAYRFHLPPVFLSCLLHTPVPCTGKLSTNICFFFTFFFRSDRQTDNEKSDRDLGRLTSQKVHLLHHKLDTDSYLDN